MKTTNTVKSNNLFPVVGIGASAGGLDAFKKLIQAIPEKSGMAYVLVQHLDPKHVSLLPEILRKVTTIPVVEITDDIIVRPNHIYVIPSNKMMTATDGVLQLTPRAEKNKNERNLPIDLFFTSLAEVHQEFAIGVVLSGTASDGTLGLKAIKDHGGVTFAQDGASASYESMPNSAIQSGVVDFILPPEEIPQKLLEVTKIINAPALDGESLPQEEAEVFHQIISLLRIRKGTDFTYYKPTTIRRRIFRRMVLNKNEEPAAYLQFLRENKAEQDALYQDLLIPVTDFFRDPKTFENLSETVFPLIVKNKTILDPIRIWVAGCSTGEEAYSIAICLKEFLGPFSFINSAERIQIYASDISVPAIVKARKGIYLINELNAVTPQRLDEFFTKTNGAYQVNKNIREMCIFAVHDFLKDPPFGKMDFISCRNALIYMQPYLQKKALGAFHYALNPNGFLLLGKSETISGVPDLFAFAEKKDKLFSRKDAPGRFIHLSSQRGEQNLPDAHAKSNQETIRPDFQKTADEMMLRKYTPPGVVVNEALDIVHFRGSTGDFLEQLSGKPSHNLLLMAKYGLAFELRNLMHKVKKDKAPVIKENISVEINGAIRHISIEAIPLPYTFDPHYLILFHDHYSIEVKRSTRGDKKSASKSYTDEKDLRIQVLEQELSQIREDMRGITEEQEAANEELQTANEELLSSSEELQSLNEELETGKEELQSTNEELIVVNQEMVSLNEQANEDRNYAEAIISNIRESLLVLDSNLRIKMANDTFYNTFKTNILDTEGVLIYNLAGNQWDIPALRSLLEKILPEKNVFNDFEVSHTFSSIGACVMLLNAREVKNKHSSEKLILLSIEDITERRKAEATLKESELLFGALANNIPNLAWIANPDGWVFWYNNRWYEYTGATHEEMEGWGWKSLLDKEQTPAVLERWQRSIDTGRPFEMVYSIKGADHAFRPFLTRIIPILNDDGKVIRWFGTNTDVFEQKKAEEQFRALADQAPMWVWTGDVQTNVTYANPLFLDFIGISDPAGLTDKTWDHIMHPEDRQRFSDIYKDAFERQKPFEIEFRLKNAANNYFEWIYSKSVPRFEQNNFTGYIGTAISIQEQKMQMNALKESEERFRTLGETLPQLVWLTDEKGNSIFASRKWKEYTNIDPAEDGAWEAIVHPDDLENIDKVWLHSLTTGEPYKSDVRLKSKTGQYKWHTVNGEPVFDAGNNIIKWVGAFTDTHSEKTFSRELEQQVENRTHELARANNELLGKNDELEKTNKELQSFAYVSSHDLQEPLRKIQTFANRIIVNESQNLTEKGKDYFLRMQSAAARMQQLVQDLLAFSRVNTSERKFEKVDLNRLVNELKEDFSEELLQKNGIIESGDLCAANIIPFQFRQLLYNLISNSIKFSKPEVPLRIKITSEIVKGSELHHEKLEPDSSYCHVTIQDNGIGFEPQYSEKIFEVFQRLHGRADYIGTGVGLAIVKKIVENHHGFIIAKGEPGKGASFDVYIPAV